MNEKVFLFPLFAAFLTAAMEITELKEESILTMVKRQEIVIGELLGEIEEMKIMQKHDREDIKRNGQEITNLKKENEELKAVIEANSKGHDMPDRNLAIVPDEIEMDNKSEIIRKAFSKRSFTMAPTLNPSPKKAAFSAKLSGIEHRLGDFETVIFENIITNVGGHYSGATGLFTAPEDGTYFFVATIFSCTGGYFETYLKRNGEYLVSMHVDDKDGHETGAAGIVLVLNRGDTVYVGHNGHEGTCVYGEFSNFSGFQI